MRFLVRSKIIVLTCLPQHCPSLRITCYYAATKISPFHHILKCYTELFKQLSARTQQAVCKTICINHKLLKASKYAVDNSMIIEKMVRNGGLQYFVTKFEKAVALLESSSSNASDNSDTTPFPYDVERCAQPIYDIFVEHPDLSNNSNFIYETITTFIRVSIWDTSMDAFMSGNSPVHIFMDSLDNSIISRDKNDYF